MREARTLRVAAGLLVPRSRERRRAWQDRQLRSLVRHAHANVPYYGQHFDASGLRPSDVRGAADVARLPVTERSALQARAPEDLVARGIDPSRLVTHRTSGSTGRPLSVRRTWLEERCHGLVRLLALWRCGVSPLARSVVVMARRPPDSNDSSRLVRLLQRAGFPRRDVIDCLAPPAAIADEIARRAPDVVLGLSGVLDRVAGALGPRERTRLRLGAVVTGGEVLTAAMRKRIAEGFEAPVRDMYASYECGLMAAECPGAPGAYHVADSVLLEVVRGGQPAAPGQRGEVVVTDLLSFAMPILRLRLGDVATAADALCACGARVASLRAIEGRMIDYFPLPDGRLVHPYGIVMELLKIAPWVAQYRLVQERPDRVVLHAAPARTPSELERRLVVEAAGRALGPDVAFTLELRSEIAPEAGGKLRPSRSLVASSYDTLEWERLD